MNEQQDTRNPDDIYKALQDNTWAGGNIIRGEIPRMVIIALADFTGLTARVEFHRWVFLVPGGAGVTDKVYVCIKDATDTYVFRDIGGGVAGSSTSDLKDDMVANGLVADGGATPLDLDGGVLTAGNGSVIEGDLTVQDDLSVTDNVSIGGSVLTALTLASTFAHQGGTFGAFSATPTSKPTVVGARDGNAALASFITAMANLGFITNSSSA